MTPKSPADSHKRAPDPPELPETLDGRSPVEIRRLFHALRQRQAELEAQNQALGERAQRFQTLFQDAVDAVYVHDLKGNILDVNRRACDMSGYSRQELLAMHVGDIDIQYKHQKPPEIDPLIDAANRTWLFKSQHRNKEGAVFPVEVHVGPLVLSGQPVLVTTVQDITTRTQREKALQESKEQYRLLLESISDSVYVLDREWRHIVVNDAAEQFVQIPKAQLLGGKLTDLFPGIEQTLFFETFERVMNTRQPGTAVDEFIFENGRKQWYEVHVYPVPEGILCISRNISARVRAEEALRAKNQAHKFLAEAALKLIELSTADQVFELISTSLAEVLPDAIVLVNKAVNSGQYLKITDITGLPPSMIQRAMTLIGFDPRDVCFKISEEFKDLYFQTKLYRHPDGLAEFATGVLPQMAAKAVEKLLGIQDIYTIGIAEEGNNRGNVHIFSTRQTTHIHPLLIESFLHQCFLALSRISSYQRLAESEARYRTFIDASPDLIFVKDEALRYILLNQANQALFGKTEAEIVGKTDLELMPPQMADACRCSDQQAIAQNDLVVVQERSNDKIYETRKFPVPMGNGQVGVGGVIRDITAHRQAEEALKESNRRLEQALLELQAAQTQVIQRERLAAVGQLAAGIAHDFRNLLTTIILHTHLAQRQPDLSPDLTRKLEIILGESKKAADLIQQILDFSSRSMLEAQPVDLYDLTQSVVDMLRRILPENIQLSLDTAPGARGAPAFVVQADPNRIEQVLMNLALNARDAMRQGGDLCFTLSQHHYRSQDAPMVSGMPSSISPPQADKKAGLWLCLAVSDTGVGMTEQVRAHLFEPFFTTKEIGQGTGLGLAQVHGIIRQHEGYIDVETAVGAGTTFRIYLPASETAHEHTDEDVPDAPHGQRETILLVEDNQMLRKAAQSILETLNYRVLVAANGRQALATYAKEGKIDLVITDLVMPEMGGEALMQTLRRTTPSLKGLAITGYAMQEVPEALRQVGILKVLHKPFQIDALAREVRHALDTS